MFVSQGDGPRFFEFRLAAPQCGEFFGRGPLFVGARQLRLPELNSAGGPLPSADGQFLPWRQDRSRRSLQRRGRPLGQKHQDQSCEGRQSKRQRAAIGD